MGELRYPLPQMSLIQKNTSPLLLNECISGSTVGLCHQSSEIMDSEEHPKLHPLNQVGNRFIQSELLSQTCWPRRRNKHLYLMSILELREIFVLRNPKVLWSLPDLESSLPIFILECCLLCTVPVIPTRGCCCCCCLDWFWLSRCCRTTLEMWVRFSEEHLAMCFQVGRDTFARFPAPISHSHFAWQSQYYYWNIFF